MMRSLWTGAAGMSAQQMSLDSIANNLANVNTTGYKRERLEFKTLLYQTMARADMDPANGPARPVNLQVGLGVRPVATTKIYDAGNFETTGNALDFAIEGDGFFVVRENNDEYAYTKDGAFKVSNSDQGLIVVTADGFPLMDTNMQEIVIPDGVLPKAISVDSYGALSYMNADGESVDMGMQIALAQFTNPQGLLAAGKNLLKPTVSSGEAILEEGLEAFVRSNIVQGVIEMSNVQVAEEMVKMIVSQRAYDLNSKVIQTSDDMLQQAANLKRN